MNVFVLNTGRCGSTTFVKACAHIKNFTSSHESRTSLLGKERFHYPRNHIEADNRLSWFLGRLDKAYGNQAYYVHLIRNRDDVAKSFVERYSRGIISSYRENILMNLPKNADPKIVSLDYWNTVNSNIELFLKDKNKKMAFHLENAIDDFQKFWHHINATGNLDKALMEFKIKYNKG